MKYQVPKKGPYESGLTARLMYHTVDELIKKHIVPEDFKAIRKKYGSLEDGKLWEKTEIKSELEEFLESYFFNDLNPPAGFEGILSKGIKYVMNLDGYMPDLERIYGSVDEAKKHVSQVFTKLESRLSQILGELNKIESTDGELIERNVRDAFGHLLQIYMYIEVLSENLDKYNQS